MSRIDLPDGAVVVEDADVRRVAVCHMAHRMFHALRAQRVGFCQIFSVKLLSLQLLPIDRDALRQPAAHRAAVAVAAGQSFHPLLMGDAGIAGYRHIRARRREQLLARSAARLAGDQRLPRAGRGAGIRRVHVVGGFIYDVLAPAMQHRPHDLRQHGAQPLPNAGGAGADVELSVLHRHNAPAGVRNSHAHARIFHRAGNAHIPVLLADVPDRLQGLHKTGGRRCDLPVGQHLSRTDGVAVPDLPRGNAQLMRHFGQRHFKGIAGLRHAEAAKRAGRRIVRIVCAAGDLKILVVIGSGSMRAGTLQHGTAQRGIRAGVGGHLGLYAPDDAVAVAAHGDSHLHGVALGVDQHALLAAQLHLDGSSGKIRDQRRMVLHRHILLAAEAAAHQHVGNADLLLRQTQHTGDLPRRIVGALVRGEDRHAVPLPICHGAFRFEERMLRIGRLIVVHQHIVGIADGLIGIAAAHVLFAQQIAGLVHQRRIGLRGIGGAEDGLERFVFDLDQGFCLLQDLLRLRRHQTDGVAQIVGDLPHRDHGIPVLLQMSHLDLSRDILSRINADHAGQRLRLLLVDRKDPGAGVFAAHSAAVDHAVDIHVVGVLAVALHLFRNVDTRHTLADLAALLRGVGKLPRAEDLRRQQNAVNDLDVAGAAADVVADGKRRLLARRLGIGVEQRLGGDDHARDAEAALHGARPAEGIGVNFFFKIGQSLDRHDRLAFKLVCLRDARLGGLAVDEHVTSAACALAASVLDGGQTQLIP